MIKLEKDNLDELIKKEKCVIDFFATWCGPCKMLTPVLEEFDDKINIIEVDIDKFPSLAEKYRIMAVPTLIFYKDGVKKEECVGFKDNEELEKIINSL